ncbi:MAG: HigA family addiction module antidote protein [Candidatus Brocadia sp.]|nr:HigA family addiction module antidote protein [Candidatus Brocadia sp.]
MARRRMLKLQITTNERIPMGRLPPIHPGEILLEDFMKPLELSSYRVAKDIGVPALRISQIVRGQRSITADTAMRLARYFGTSAGIWLRLQARYDLEIAEAKMAKRINREVKVLQATQPSASNS